MTDSAPYFLTTPRLGFRCWTPADISLAEALWTDPAVMRFLGGPYSLAQAWERLEAEIERQATSSFQSWPLFDRATGAHVGCCGLKPLRREERIPEFGFHLRPEWWGRGLAEEAGRAVIAHAFFGPLEVPAIFTGHHPEHGTSRRVLEKLGFQYVEDVYYPPTGLMHRTSLLHRPEGPTLR
ncbi:MAG TPA: GNAT family N-acetyltransferase [bacterium]|nr:GNAT family N-acetyltransferase [bacterium]